MLGRLRITQRLSLLLLLPLGAVASVSLPFAVDRADAARAAGAIVDSAHNADVLGAVIQQLQRERLLAIGYLASPRLDRTVLVSQIQSTSDAAARARTAVRGDGASDAVAGLARLDELSQPRRRVLARDAAVGTVFTRYGELIESLINTLRLGDQPRADAAGLRQMTSLDALVRLNEEATKIGAALVLAAADPVLARDLIAVAQPLERAHLERFRQTGDRADVELFEGVASGPTADRTAALAASLAGAATVISVEESFSAANNGIGIRHFLQDRVTTEIRGRADARAAAARTAAVAVGTAAFVLVGLVAWLGVAVGRSVSRPLRRVTVAATAVADLAAREMARVADMDSENEAPPRLAAVMLRSDDEIGELASAFNRVQATAALLMEQQATTRRNVAVMFGNIAHRTHSLVSRQLADIDELERQEHDEERLERLYRLDHLTTRLRRSADSLLVIAGVDQAGQIPSPARLADVIRSAIAEVEGYQSIRLGAVSDIGIVAAAVSDLTLLLAELLENATSFSPPDVPVDVTASVGDGCLIRVVDHGIGMSPQRLAEENGRLLSRERLDLAPTTMLGLIVVGRLARRHGLTVRLLPTAVSGVTAEVVLPPTLLMGAARPVLAPSNPPVSGRSVPRSAALPAAAAPPPDFTWFDRYGHEAGVPATTVNGSASASAAPSRNGLRQRQPGSHLVAGPVPTADLSVSQRDRLAGGRHAIDRVRSRDPQAERAALDDFASGEARAHARAAGFGSAGPAPREITPPIGRPPEPGSGSPSRGGLQQRQPGRHLDQNLQVEPRHRRTQPGGGPHAAPASRIRDAAAERAQLLGYLDGLSRAAENAEPSHEPWRRT